jgi:tRNA threonylcarbamoyladenosine biosynthesis protein TsaB
MLVLGIDTSSKPGSIALVECGAGSARTLEVVPLEGGTFSAQLVPQISRLLGRQGLRKAAIDALAVATGPGSFTGLRVGLAAVKGLAEILHQPIAGVSWLEAVACSGGETGRVLAVLDAGRGELYCGEYDVTGSTARLIRQELVAVCDFLGRGSLIRVVTPDSNVAALALEHNIPVTRIEPLRADAIARIGFKKIQAGETTTVDSLDANYIRPADAEIKRTSPAGSRPAPGT